MLFGIMQLVSLVAGWAAALYLFGTVFATSAALNLPPNPTPDQVSAALGPLFQSLSYIVPLAGLIQLVGLVILTMAFRAMGKFDRPRFSTPSTLMILMTIGLVISVVGVVPLVNSVPNIISQTANGTASSAYSSVFTSFILEALLVGLGGLLALIGLIGGQILGIWRVGSRYDETLLKLGAVFVIIPLLNIVAPILVIVGANQAKGKVPRGQ